MTIDKKLEGELEGISRENFGRHSYEDVTNSNEAERKINYPLLAVYGAALLAYVAADLLY